MFQAFCTELVEICWQLHATKQESEGKLQSCNTEIRKELALEGFFYAILKNPLPKCYVHVNCIHWHILEGGQLVFNLVPIISNKNQKSATNALVP